MRCRLDHQRRPVSRSRRPESTRISTVVFASWQLPYAMRKWWSRSRPKRPAPSAMLRGTELVEAANCRPSTGCRFRAGCVWQFEGQADVPWKNLPAPSLGTERPCQGRPFTVAKGLPLTRPLGVVSRAGSRGFPWHACAQSVHDGVGQSPDRGPAETQPDRSSGPKGHLVSAQAETTVTVNCHRHRESQIQTTSG